MRFGDYLNSIPLPAILGVFKAEEWDNSGLITVNSSLIYSIIDVLLGGRRGQTAIRIEGRPYTTIETNLVKRMVEVVLADAELAFKPLSPVKFNIDRLETNPRFAAISRPANAAILVRLRIDMEDRGGLIELLLPYATIEPIREVLLQMFMGEKFGRDPIWEGHLATEIGSGGNRRRRRALRGAIAVKADHEARSRRYADARAQDRRRRDSALRRRDADRRPHGPRRRPRRRARRQASAQTHHDARAVRNGRRLRQPDGGTVTNGLGMIIEILVTFLLMVTIAYCMLLNRRLKRLKSDEHSLRATISELVTATGIAERAIGGLKLTVKECELGLGGRLGNAERLSADLERNIGAGKEVLERLAQIVAAGQGALPGTPVADRIAGAAGTISQWQRALTAPPRQDAQAVAAAAQAFADRLRAKVTGRAA